MLLRCLKQTESKYGEALVRSDGLNKHAILPMWKITEMRKTCPFFFSENVYITFVINSFFRISQWGLWFILNLIL